MKSSIPTRAGNKKIFKKQWKKIANGRVNKQIDEFNSSNYIKHHRFQNEDRVFGKKFNRT